MKVFKHRALRYKSVHVINYRVKKKKNVIHLASKLKLPPIRDTAKLRELSANNTKELKNQNFVLQQQLKDSKTENKILKNVLHRHTVALQQYQDLDGSISQVGGPFVLRCLRHKMMLGTLTSTEHHSPEVAKVLTLCI